MSYHLLPHSPCFSTSCFISEWRSVSPQHLGPFSPSGQGRFMAGREGAAPASAVQGGGWAVSGPAASSQSPRAEREQRGDSYQFRVSWAGLEDWGVWPVTGHQWPPVSSSDQQPLQPQGVTSDRDRPALRSPGREASHRDVGTFRLGVAQAGAQGEQRYHGQWQWPGWALRAVLTFWAIWGHTTYKLSHLQCIWVLRLVTSVTQHFVRSAWPFMRSLLSCSDAMLPNSKSHLRPRLLKFKSKMSKFWIGVDTTINNHNAHPLHTLPHTTTTLIDLRGLSHSE